MIREAMKMVSEQDEADLADAPTDEEIADVFDFEDANPVNINIVAEFNMNGDVTKAIGGATYAFKDLLTKKGFEFDRAITKMWHAPVDTDTDDIEAMMEQYGFNVENFDDAVHEE